MEKPVATINGKTVYSDKNVQSIVGTRISFTDGSWCDVSTGQVSNLGGGYINIGTPGVSGKKDRKEQIYPVMPVSIRGLNANVSVNVADVKKITVTTEGNTEDLKRISISPSSGTLTIEDNSSKGARGGIVLGNVVIGGGRFSSSVISSGSSITISGGRTTIISGHGDVSTQMTITLPLSTKVSVSGICGFTEIGDTLGDIEINANTGGDYQVGKIHNAFLNIQGSGDINVSEVNGNLNASVQGSGDIDVRRGNVPMLTANIQGSGDIYFGGNAENANLNVMGSGDIEVEFVKNRPTTNIMGTGDIEVGNWKKL